jgi:Na+/H+ antiporter NhaD/arsenite permease-like protein
VTIAVVILALVYALLALQRVPRIRLQFPAGAMLGAAAMVAAGVVPLRDAVFFIPLDLLLFLFGMLVISVYLQAGNTVGFFAERALRIADTPLKLMLFFLFTGAVTAALTLNITAALILAPMVLATCKHVGENPARYIIALILGINLGSAATAVGSPQTMLVVSLSGMGFWEYTSKMALVSAMGVAIAALWLVLTARRCGMARSFKDTVRHIVPQSPNFTGVSALVVLTAVIIAMVSGAPMAVAATTGAGLLLAVNPQPPKDVLSVVNWQLIVFIASLFVIVGGAAESDLIEKSLPTIVAALKDNAAAQVAGVAALASSLTALFSNVPSATLLAPIVSSFENPKVLWFTAALATTFAGNVSLFGSLSNLTAVEICEEKGFRIAYLDFIKTGLPVSILTLVTGVLLVVRL